jgi:hypothetical protein
VLSSTSSSGLGPVCSIVSSLSSPPKLSDGLAHPPIGALSGKIVIDPDRCPQGDHPTRRNRSGTFVAKIEDRPLYRVISDRFNHGAADESVPVYAAAGYYYPGKDLDALPAELLGNVELGHTLVKIKIGGASLDEDPGRIEAGRSARLRPPLASGTGLRAADRDRRKPLLRLGRPQPRPTKGCDPTATCSDGSRAQLWAGRVSAPAGSPRWFRGYGAGVVRAVEAHYPDELAADGTVLSFRTCGSADPRAWSLGRHTKVCHRPARLPAADVVFTIAARAEQAPRGAREAAWQSRSLRRKTARHGGDLGPP